MVRKFAHGTAEKVYGTHSISHIYLQDSAACCMSFQFAKAAWLQDSVKKLDYFKGPKLGAPDVLLKEGSSPVPFVVDEG